MDAGHVQVRRGPSVVGEGTARALAEACLLGLPARAMLRSHDPDEQDVWEEVRVEAAKLWDEMMTTMARKIVHEQAEAEKRGARRKPNS